MTNFTKVFGDQTIPPSGTSYSEITLTESITLIWPYNTVGDYPLTNIIDFDTDIASLVVTLPGANEVSVGEDFLFRNLGSEAIDIVDAIGGAVKTIQPGFAVYIYVADNSTVAGLFRTIDFGVGSSSVDAAALAGMGLVAIGGTLNTEHAVYTTASADTVVESMRAQLYNYTGGAATLPLSPASTLGDGFFVMVHNSGTGTLTINPDGAETIDGVVSVQLQPNEAAFVVCTGAAFLTVGLGRSLYYNFTQLVFDVSAGGSFTLTSAQASNKLLTFVGNPASAVTVIVPNVVSVYYVLSQLSTAQSVTVKTLAGTGVAVPQGERVIAICDATNVYSAQSVAVSSVLSMLDGSAAMPALNFASQTNTGLYKYSPDGLGIAVAGSSVLGLLTTGADWTIDQNVTKATPTVTYEDTDTTLTDGQEVFVMNVQQSDTNNPGISAKFRALADGTAGLLRLVFSAGLPSALVNMLGIKSTGVTVGTTTLPTDSTFVVDAKLGSSTIPTVPTGGAVAVLANASAAGDTANLSVISGTTGNASLWLGDTASSSRGGVLYNNSNDSIALYTAGNFRLNIDSSGRVKTASSSVVGASGGALTVSTTTVASPPTPNIGADDLIIESTSPGMTFMGTTSGSSTEIAFTYGGAGTGSVAAITYTGSSSAFTIQPLTASTAGVVVMDNQFTIGPVVPSVADDSFLAVKGRIQSDDTYTTTTASAANVFISSAATFARSTSSAAFKTDVEDMELSRARALVQSFRAVWYRSTCAEDRADWSWYGAIAEEVAEIDPRFVSYGYAPEDYEAVERNGKMLKMPKKDAVMRPDGLMYERFTAPLMMVCQDYEKRVSVLEQKLAALEAQISTQ